MNFKEKNLLKQQVFEVYRKLFFSKATLDQCLQKATPSQMEMMYLIATTELESRQHSRKVRYVRNANFPVLKTFADYDFSHVKFPELLDKQEMLSLRFIGEHKTLVWYGSCGTGKTHATIALGILACNNDFKVKFFTVSQLVLLLKKAHYDGSLEKVLHLLSHQDLLILDELGYIPMDLESAQLLFRVISDAYERKSLIITTNLPFSEWGKTFTDDQLAAAMIDRIVHHGHLIQTGDKDWRLEHSLMLNKRRAQ